MSFATEKENNDNLDTYSRLEREKTKIVNAITTWMAGATALHTAVSGDATKQGEVVALRDALKTEGAAALNS